MKKPLFAFVLVLVFASSTYSQDQNVTLDKTQFTLSILPLMAHVEVKAAEKQSFTFGGGLAYSVFYQNINGEGDLEAYTSPFLTTSFRNYYKRNQVKKSNLRNNSGNYVGLLSSYTFESIVTVGGDTFATDLDTFTIGPVWGFQRNYASGIHLDLSLGIGYITGQSDEFIEIENGVTLIGGFEFGFRFN